MTLAQLIEERSIPEPNSGCLLWLGPMRGEYGVIYDKYRHRQFGSHRVALELKIGRPVPEGIFVCHSCDVKLCVNPDHLFEGTAQDNSDDLVRKGRSGKGHKAHNARFSDEIVMKIFDDCRPYLEIKREYGIAVSSISQIKSGKAWSRVTGKNYDRLPRDKSLCAAGLHLWNEANARTKIGGDQYCNACSTERMRRYRAVQKVTK